MKERRRKRDELKQKALEAAQAARMVQLEAELLLKKEAEEKARLAKREEEREREHMAAIRRQMRARQKRER